MNEYSGRTQCKRLSSPLETQDFPQSADCGDGKTEHLMRRSHKFSRHPDCLETTSDEAADCPEDACTRALPHAELASMEREALVWLSGLWGAEPFRDYRGAVSESRAELNVRALRFASKIFPDATLLHGEDAHGSVVKASNMYGLRTRVVQSLPSGAMSIPDLKRTLAGDADRPVILALASATSVKGAHDDIGAAMDCLDAIGIPPERRYVHLDAAASGLVLPFIEASVSVTPHFRLGFDSLSVSAHGMLGVHAPIGVLMVNRKRIERWNAALYADADVGDPTCIEASKRAVAALWTALAVRDESRMRAEIEDCLSRAHRLCGALMRLGVPALQNRHSLIVAFPAPDPVVVQRYRLRTNRGIACLSVTPGTEDAWIGRFVADYLQWWEEFGVHFSDERNEPAVRADMAPPFFE